MDDDALRIVLYGGGLAGVYLLARFARRISDQASTTTSFPAPELEPFGPAPEPMGRPRGLVGSEIPFPFDVRELETRYGPGVWRPIVLNYFFREADLIAGPRNPEDFYDEFFVECEHPETGYRWRTSFYVTTPKGIERVMTEDRTDYLFGDTTIVVRHFDLKTILRAVMESFAEANDPRLREARNGPPPANNEE
ncbi:MAG: hypothetical protein L0212_03425 [Acidobacteria bacterium]|nr:hypothetical protein [Acidobacteriota bacterium]